MIYPTLYKTLLDEAVDNVTVNTNPTDADYKQAERYLTVYSTLFYNESLGISNVFSHCKKD